jgi:hypothetical protein
LFTSGPEERGKHPSKAAVQGFHLGRWSLTENQVTAVCPALPGLQEAGRQRGLHSQEGPLCNYLPVTVPSMTAWEGPKHAGDDRGPVAAPTRHTMNRPKEAAVSLP